MNHLTKVTMRPCDKVPTMLFLTVASGSAVVSSSRGVVSGDVMMSAMMGNMTFSFVGRVIWTRNKCLSLYQKARAKNGFEGLKMCQLCTNQVHKITLQDGTNQSKTP